MQAALIYGLKLSLRERACQDQAEGARERRRPRVDEDTVGGDAQRLGRGLLGARDMSSSMSIVYIYIRRLLSAFGRRVRCRISLEKAPEDVARQIVVLSLPIASGHVSKGVLMVDGGAVAVP